MQFATVNIRGRAYIFLISFRNEENKWRAFESKFVAGGDGPGENKLAFVRLLAPRRLNTLLLLQSARHETRRHVISDAVSARTVARKTVTYDSRGRIDR